MAIYDDFMKIDLRIARITGAEEVAGAEKLLKLEVDLGTEKRQIIAGIKKSYAAKDLIGREVAVIANLEPRMIMGLESQGMLLAASDDKGISILTPDRDLPPGSVVK